MRHNYYMCQVEISTKMLFFVMCRKKRCSFCLIKDKNMLYFVKKKKHKMSNAVTHSDSQTFCFHQNQKKMFQTLHYFSSKKDILKFSRRSSLKFYMCKYSDLRLMKNAREGESFSSEVMHL